MPKYNDISKSEYEGLYDNLTKIQMEIDELHKKYEETKAAISYYKMFHDPNVIITRDNSGNYDRWLGRIKVPLKTISNSKYTNKSRYYLNFHIADGPRFKDKHDPELIKLAKEKGIEYANKKKGYLNEHFNQKQVIKLTESELIRIIKQII